MPSICSYVLDKSLHHWSAPNNSLYLAAQMESPQYPQGYFSSPVWPLSAVQTLPPLVVMFLAGFYKFICRDIGSKINHLKNSARKNHDQRFFQISCRLPIMVLMELPIEHLISPSWNPNRMAPVISYRVIFPDLSNSGSPLAEPEVYIIQLRRGYPSSTIFCVSLWTFSESPLGLWVAKIASTFFVARSRSVPPPSASQSSKRFWFRNSG